MYVFYFRLCDSYHKMFDRMFTTAAARLHCKLQRALSLFGSAKHPDYPDHVRDHGPRLRVRGLSFLCRDRAGIGEPDSGE